MWSDKLKMVATTTKVYLLGFFFVLVIGFYSHRVVPRDRGDHDLNHQDTYNYFRRVLVSPGLQDYDYFYLALQWPPSLCNTPSNKCREDVKNFTYFTIHGLWPQKQNGRRFNCTSGTALNITKLRSDKNLLQRLDKYWPSLLVRKTNDEFWRHEWEKHGRCIGWDQNIYFKTAVNAYVTNNISTLVEEFAKHGIQKGGSYTIGNYTEAIQKILHVRSTIQSISNRINATLLFEIRLCVDKTGKNLTNCDLIAFPKWDDEISNVHFQLPDHHS